jgi:hypothetical protein
MDFRFLISKEGRAPIPMPVEHINKTTTLPIGSAFSKSLAISSFAYGLSFVFVVGSPR